MRHIRKTPRLPIRRLHNCNHWQGTIYRYYTPEHSLQIIHERSPSILKRPHNMISLSILYTTTIYIYMYWIRYYDTFTFTVIHTYVFVCLHERIIYDWARGRVQTFVVCILQCNSMQMRVDWFHVSLFVSVNKYCSFNHARAAVASSVYRNNNNNNKNCDYRYWCTHFKRSRARDRRRAWKSFNII